jgi:hypothetical protein
MSEVGVAFPNDETTAEVIASRLRADGIAARVDRGLHGSWQVPSRGQITVLVASDDVARARKVLGTETRAERPPSPWARVALAVLFGALAVGLVAIVLTIAPR